MNALFLAMYLQINKHLTLSKIVRNINEMLLEINEQQSRKTKLFNLQKTKLEKKRRMFFQKKNTNGIDNEKIFLIFGALKNKTLKLN